MLGKHNTVDLGIPYATFDSGYSKFKKKVKPLKALDIVWSIEKNLNKYKLKIKAAHRLRKHKTCRARKSEVLKCLNIKTTYNLEKLETV